MPKKKQKATLAGDGIEEKHPSCHIRGCKEPGVYKAPKSRASLHDYAWYCLDHIREYNQKWDYFSGMNREQIEAFMRDALTGHRPTWSREGKPQYSHYSYEELKEALDDFLFINIRHKKPARFATGLNAKLREALAAMDMDYPFTAQELKLRYRSLVKQFHPDANKGDRHAEEKFKRVAVAYLLLAEHLKKSTNQ